MARILVIDDNEQIRTLLRRCLESVGHDVEEASDGIRGLKTFQAQPADLVFCDLLMPEKDGLGTIRELRHQAPAVKIIAMSGGAVDDKVDFLTIAQKLGASQVLNKPFEITKLLAMVKEVLS